MFNIFNFTKLITNMAKLHKELSENTLFGSLFSFATSYGDQLSIHFTQNLNQSQIDELSAKIASFSSVSIKDTLEKHLDGSIDPFVKNLLLEMRAENIEMGITQAGKTLEVLGFFEEPILLPGKTRKVTLQGSLMTGSLTVTLEILTYLISNPSLYADLNPFVTATRLDSWKTKIITKLS